MKHFKYFKNNIKQFVLVVFPMKLTSQKQIYIKAQNLAKYDYWFLVS